MKIIGYPVAIFLCLLLFPALPLAVEVGNPAPDFELASTNGGRLKLSSLRGKNVLINFYILDFSPV